MLAKVVNRLQRKQRVRVKISGNESRPRLNVFRSSSHIYAQLIDDVAGKTLCEASDLKIMTWTKTQRAQKVGEDLAKKAKALNINEIVFDRGGFAYHGRVKALAEGARSTGLQF